MYAPGAIYSQRLPATGPVLNPGAQPGWENWPTKPDTEMQRVPDGVKIDEDICAGVVVARLPPDEVPHQQHVAPPRAQAPPPSSSLFPVRPWIQQLPRPLRPALKTPQPQHKPPLQPVFNDNWVSLAEASGRTSPVRPTSAASNAASTSTSSSGKSKKARKKNKNSNVNGALNGAAAWTAQGYKPPRVWAPVSVPVAVPVAVDVDDDDPYGGW
jgi:hypothetical protein